MSLVNFKKEIGFNNQDADEQEDSLNNYFDDFIAPGVGRNNIDRFRESFLRKNITAKKKRIIPERKRSLYASLISLITSLLKPARLKPTRLIPRTTEGPLTSTKRGTSLLTPENPPIMAYLPIRQN